MPLATAKHFKDIPPKSPIIEKSAEIRNAKSAKNSIPTASASKAAKVNPGLQKHQRKKSKADRDVNQEMDSSPSRIVRHEVGSSNNMESAGANQLSLVPVSLKLEKSFYESLVVLAILGKSRGANILSHDEYHRDLDSSESNPQRLRRAYVRSLAYLCDYEKGGDSATAIAIQTTPRGLVY